MVISLFPLVIECLPRPLRQQKKLFPKSLVHYVEGSRYQDHCRCQMDTPSQLKMILPSFDLQKMSGQGVRTHPPMVLLAFISNILIFSLGPSSFGKESLPSFTVWGSFIVPGVLSLLMVGRLFGLSWWC